jgi:2-dehydropantoate 2-reductase
VTAASARVLVLGTGALASYLGGLLARSGRAAVTLAGTWEAGLRALGEHGITVEEEGGTWRTPVRAVPLAEVCEPADYVLVLVKAYRTAAVAPVAARATAAGGLVVSLQNGWGNRETLARHAGDRVAAGIIVVGATLLGPAHVRAFGGQVLLGMPPAASAPFAELLQSAGLPAETTTDVERHLWRKLAANCSINPLTALLRVPNGALLDDPDVTARLVAAAREVGAVAAARGVDLGADAGTLALEVARRFPANHSSMLQDVARGAPTEIDALCGAVSEEGRRLGVPTPVNDQLLAAVRALSAGVATA